MTSGVHVYVCVYVCVHVISPLQVRIMNDQLMYLERAFIDPLGLPDRPFYRLVSHNLSL